nr:uncharacterized protein LOC129155176 [Nothobranchius furzeri]
MVFKVTFPKHAKGDINSGPRLAHLQNWQEIICSQSMKRTLKIKDFFKRKKAGTTEQDRSASINASSQSESQLEDRPQQKGSPASAVHMELDKDSGDEGCSTLPATPEYGVSSQPHSDHETDTEDQPPEVPISPEVSHEESDVAASCAPRGPHDISQSRAAGPTQLQLKIFPKTVFGERKRSFNSSWYDQHSWLECSASKDSAYCYACRHFSLPSASESVFTSESGFSHWKKAMFKDGGVKLQKKSVTHYCHVGLESTKESCTNRFIHNGYDKPRIQRKVEENCSYIKTIADVLLLTATQNMAQRGHSESESDNRGNFLEILEVIAKHNPVVARKLKDLVMLNVLAIRSRMKSCSV